MNNGNKQAHSVLFNADSYSYQPVSSSNPNPNNANPYSSTSMPQTNPDGLQFYQNTNYPSASSSAAIPSTSTTSSSSRPPVGLTMGNMNTMNHGDNMYGFGNGPSSSPTMMQGANNFGLPFGVSPGLNFRALRSAFGASSLSDDEPPLLEELGINFLHIKNKGMVVLNPFKTIDKHIMDDADLAGPLIFCFLFGGFLLLSGKLQFGYIYGISFLGVLSMYFLLNLMADLGLDVWRTASVLGYCLLPMVLLSVFCSVLGLGGVFALILAIISVLWCTWSASTMFTTVLSMQNQKVLVAYPIGLLYSLFALLAVF